MSVPAVILPAIQRSDMDCGMICLAMLAETERGRVLYIREMLFHGADTSQLFTQPARADPPRVTVMLGENRSAFKTYQGAR